MTCFMDRSEEPALRFSQAAVNGVRQIISA